MKYFTLKLLDDIAYYSKLLKESSPMVYWSILSTIVFYILQFLFSLMAP